MAVTSVDDLRNHLQWAIEIEHSTIPPYLYAYFSIEDSSSAAAQTIRSVVLEEMLHMTLACNMLNAVGGSPEISSRSFVPSYPGPVPHHAPDPPLVVHLAPASVDVIATTFLAIERPETVNDVPQDDNYTTLGQFYAAIADGFTTLNSTVGAEALFSGDPKRQVTDVWRDPTELFAVTDLRSALDAINEIVEQGEGTSQTEFDPQGELAHYWRFNQIVDGTTPLGSVYPAATDPSAAGSGTGPLRGLSQLFDDCYGLLLRTLHQVFNGGDTDSLNGAMFTLMTQVLPPIATLLMQTPIPGGSTNAGPAFEFSETAQSQVLENCKGLKTTYSALDPVYTALLGLPAIDGSVASVLDAGLHGVTPLRGMDWVPPARVPDTSRFARMFPNLDAYQPSPDLLVALGMSGGPMDAGTSIPPTELSQTIPAGFTYFGQFLDHNITFDADSSLDKADDPMATTNFRSGRIDLEHVYGLGPETQAFEYYDQNEVGKFWLDLDAPWDVPRNKQGTALIADPRNDNTVITTQIHLAFMKFHNAVVDLLAPTTAAPDLFDHARQLVVWHYQWLVLNEWLPLILLPDVYADIKQNGLKYYTWTDRPYIPVEFNVAAYRLHALVLEGYQLNANRYGVLFDLRKPFAPLPQDDAIDWSYFFDFGDGKTQYAKRFEARIANTFLNIPGPIDNPLEWPFDAATGNRRSIAVRNLLRGYEFGLPAGQDVAAAMNFAPLTNAQLGLDIPGFTAAPLWYYVLAEADFQTGGVTLGQVGSRIVGEVFVGLVKGDPTSYLNVNPGWTPTLGSGGTFSMTDLLTIAGVHPAAQG